VSSPAAQRKACCVIRHFNAVTTTVNQAYSFILLAASNPAHPAAPHEDGIREKRTAPDYKLVTRPI
jgi:hypothetical protein